MCTYGTGCSGDVLKKEHNIARLSEGRVWLCIYWLSCIAAVIALEKQTVLHHSVRKL